MSLQLNLRMFFVSLILLLVTLPILAQNKEIRGTVYETDGRTPLVGATVLAKGTANGSITDLNGEYKLKLTGEHLVLEFQSLGFTKQEIPVGRQSVINVVMKESAVQLDGVVVTALGLTREEKSLGYAVTKVNSEALTSSISSNWLNSMSGKVAGLTFDQAGSGPGGSMRVTLRGDQSLNYGSNEALFVVDGIPVSSGTTATVSASNYANADAPVDFGNGASDINPEDIESVTVLKGPAATALYGSRAANGAIVITTKSGRKDKGIGITVNSSVSFEQAGYFPDFQTKYGSGSDMGQNEYCFWPLTSAMASDGVATGQNISRYAFGEKFDPSKLRYQYASKDWETGTFTKTPWAYQDDWYTGIFQTGVTYNNTVTIDGSNGNGTNTRLSITDTRNDWILPNTGYEKQSVSLAFNTEVNKYIKLNAKVNYYHKGSDNMPVSGYDETSVMYALVWGYNSNSINDWKNEYFQHRYNYANWSNVTSENGNSLVFPSSSSYNPYRTLYEEVSTLDKDRMFGNIGLTFSLYKGLTLDVKSGLDMNDEFRTQRKPFYVAGAENGFYREQTIRQYEFNTDFLLKYINNSWVNKHLGFTAALGGNNMTSKYFTNKITLSQLNEEGVYNTENVPAGITPDPYNYRSKKVVNSLYGLTSLSWDDTYFLDITGRNDWSSTLARGNWSFFYPSVCASVLLDKVFNFQQYASWVDFMKFRLSWANVGNDTSPYALDQYYGSTNYSGGYVLPGTIPDPMIKPENVESWETGLEVRLLQNRIAFDVALYTSSTTDQIVSADMDQITGATGMKINAGEIQNKGIEVSARFVPVRNRDFTWSFNVNWSRNWNKLVSLQDGWDPNEPLQTDMGTTIGSRTYIYSYVGKEMNVIYGRGYQRAPEGSFYLDENGKKIDCSGMELVDASTGYPVLDTDPTRKIGKVNPDWRAGMTQSLTYKNITLSADFSAQLGGNCFSVTNFSLSYQGKLKNSLEGRYDGLVHEGVNAVKSSDGTITYTKNNTITSNIQTYYNTYIWNRNNTEANTFDTSFLKLKEVRLDYKLPVEVCLRTGFLQGASIGAYATNIFCLTSFPQYDPETGMLNGSNIYKGIETMAYPMTRTYGMNIKLSF
ncbi:SusC/RagA family TonB-linked outer membrane protein [uncultured Bacteroides sp.]|uniref:SusC/RagA family TonB-linked outer membrane protein n=1 Tax=uncultured Bacteroides sp. TaxID=162156 RepID=UPI002AA6EB5C|nr:SusC/RagA family TonB-linked outer membrane protein [uncultured Bacteroides sp.]